MTQTSAEPSNLNVPNALTGLRLILVPVFGWLLLAQDGTNPTLRFAAAVVFIFASATDYVDGALARKHNLVTTFGKVADPIADKALTGMHLVECEADERREARAVERGDLLSGRHGRLPCRCSR